MTTVSTAPTAERALAGPGPLSPEATLAALYERHASRIFGFCRRRLRTPHEAEDAVQTTFLAALQALQRGTVPVCETAWLFKIAENACHGVYRSGARRDDRELTEPDALARHAGPDRTDDALVGLEAALETISENQRKAFVLRELRGLSYAEIAGQLGVSIASVETLIYRARRGVARALEHGAGLRRRVAAALDLGSLAAAGKAWIGSLSAVKVATAAAVIATATVSAHDLLIPEPASPARVPIQKAANELSGVTSRADEQARTAAPAIKHPALGRSRAAVDSRSPEGPRPVTPSSDGEKPSSSATGDQPQQPGSPPPAPGGMAPSVPPAPPPGAGSPSTPPPDGAKAPIELPSAPVELPSVPLPLPPPPPLPEAPSLPDLPPLPDAGASLPQVPQLP
jgi:RNA polymerase sigma-70 factor (ECF subfamily)